MGHRTPNRVLLFVAAAVVGAGVGWRWLGLGHPWADLTGRGGRPGPASRPAGWAVPVGRPGLPNLHRVSKHLYRGAQPDETGVRELAALGVRTVVNLRLTHSDRELLDGTGLGYEHIRMEAWDADTDEVVRFLRIVTDPDRLPVFVHCRHGADRTGTMCAIHRMVVQDWTADEAIREMTEGGYGYHETFKNLVEYLREVDLDRLRRQAGLAGQ